MKNVRSLGVTLCSAFVAVSLYCQAPAMAVDAAVAPSRLSSHRLDGQVATLAEGKGRTSVLVFWSPASLSSRKSMPELQRFVHAADHTKLFILAVSTERDPAVLKAFIAERALELPVAMRGDDDFGPLPEWRLPIIYVFDEAGLFVNGRAGLFNMKTLRNLSGTGEPQ